MFVLYVSLLHLTKKIMCSVLCPINIFCISIRFVIVSLMLTLIDMCTYTHVRVLAASWDYLNDAILLTEPNGSALPGFSPPMAVCESE
jgi:hypothetical protein